MKRKELYRVLAITLTLSLATPFTVMASDSTQMATETEVESDEVAQEPEQEVDTTPETQPETEPETEQEKESEPEKENKDDGSTEATTGDTCKGREETTPVEPPLEETPKADDGAEEVTSTNEELVKNQQIIHMPEIEQDFRFWTVTKTYAFAKEEVMITEAMDVSARAVGKLVQGGVCYILQEENGWLYVESGTVRGFVKAELLETGDTVKSLLEEYQARVNEGGEEVKASYFAEELVSRNDNKAFLHTRTTAYKTVVKKDYGVSTVQGLHIREDKDENSRVVGTMGQGGICYILADKEQEWVYVESGNARGFVKRAYLDNSEELSKEIEAKGEKQYTTAKEAISPKDNKACYYTLTSVKSGEKGGKQGEAVVTFASQFIGNPYVWGGVSLTDGADCSGFVQSVYREFALELPRVAESQAQYGTKIPVEDAQPGDLIFYAKNGYVDHVVIYAGNGRTVEAMGTKYGIVNAALIPGRAVWATRILDQQSGTQNAESDIHLVNATAQITGEDLGAFKITYFSTDEECSSGENSSSTPGVSLIEGQTVAVDPSVIPYGTEIIVDGHIFIASDCGRKVEGNEIAIYVNDHDHGVASEEVSAQVQLVKK